MYTFQYERQKHEALISNSSHHRKKERGKIGKKEGRGGGREEGGRQREGEN
jgi:hypothetical protein